MTCSDRDAGAPSAGLGLGAASVRRRARWVAYALVAVAVACWALVAALGALPGDAHTAAEVREDAVGPILLVPAHALDWLGRLPGALLVTVLVAAAGWRTSGVRYGLLAVACLGASVITGVVKVITERPRPSLAGYMDYSFPSGHTTFAAAVVGFATLLAIKERRFAVALGLAAIVAAMGPSRVLLGVHWLSDVVAGYAIGFAWLIFVVLVGLPRRRDGAGAAS